MSRSIIQDKNEHRCYLCKLFEEEYHFRMDLEEHHIFFGNPNRSLSERYGLKVYLCLNHHRIGREAVHRNRETDLMLKQIGQRAFEERYGHDQFVAVFGKNWIETKTEPAGGAHKSAEPGFRFINEEENHGREEGTSGVYGDGAWDGIR